MVGRFAAAGSTAGPVREAATVLAVIFGLAIVSAFMFWAGALSVSDEAPAVDRCERLCAPLDHHTRAGKCYCEVTP